MLGLAGASRQAREHACGATLRKRGPTAAYACLVRRDRVLGACAGARARQAHIRHALARLVRYGLQLCARFLRAERLPKPSAQVGL